MLNGLINHKVNRLTWKAHEVCHGFENSLMLSYQSFKRILMPGSYQGIGSQMPRLVFGKKEISPN